MRFFVRLTLFVIFSAATCSWAEIPDGFREYEVRAGDNLFRIAPRDNWDIIKKVNRIDEAHLIIGKKIFLPYNLEEAKKFVPVPQYMGRAQKFRKAIFVFLDLQYFGAYENGRLIFWGPICSGSKEKSTPKGFFNVRWKKKFHHSKKYDADMPFAVNISNNGIFLHQQSLPGRPVSHGCIRLLETDAKIIYKWVRINDPIILAKKVPEPGTFFLCPKNK